MYKSPIEMFTQQMITEQENELCYKCSQAVGYNINRDELIKALKFDRHQYDEGYNEGYNAGITTLTCWQKCEVSLPTKEGFYFVVYDYEIMILWYQPDNDEDEHWGLWHHRYDSGTLEYIDSDFEAYGDEQVKYWMNIPEIPEE